MIQDDSRYSRTLRSLSLAKTFVCHVQVSSTLDPVKDEFRIKEATDRTLRWIDRCISAHRKPESQNLFGIVQGHLDTKPGGLREYSLKDLGLTYNIDLL